jgi:hypothetical protein
MNTLSEQEVHKRCMHRKINISNSSELPFVNSIAARNLILISWCITRPDLGISMEPVINISQFKTRSPNPYAKFLTYEQYLQFVKPSKDRKPLQDVKCFPQVGEEIYFGSLYSERYYRCKLLFSGNYNDSLIELQKYLECCNVDKKIGWLNDHLNPFRFSVIMILGFWVVHMILGFWVPSSGEKKENFVVC